MWIDERLEYGELRMIALAPKTNILYFVAFVDRAEMRRIIGLRRATRLEVNHYVESCQATSHRHADARGGRGHHRGDDH